MKRRALMIITLLALGLLAAGCSGETTGVSKVGRYSANLHAVGSCDGRCIVYFQIRESGGLFRKTKPQTVGKIGRTHFHVNVTGLKPGRDYGFQVCGAEQQKGGMYQPICVGPGGDRTKTSNFRTLTQHAATTPRDALDLDAAMLASSIEIGG